MGKGSSQQQVGKGRSTTIDQRRSTEAPSSSAPDGADNEARPEAFDPRTSLYPTREAAKRWESILATLLADPTVHAIAQPLLEQTERLSRSLRWNDARGLAVLPRRDPDGRWVGQRMSQSVALAGMRSSLQRAVAENFPEDPTTPRLPISRRRLNRPDEKGSAFIYDRYRQKRLYTEEDVACSLRCPACFVSREQRSASEKDFTRFVGEAQRATQGAQRLLDHGVARKPGYKVRMLGDGQFEQARVLAVQDHPAWRSAEQMVRGMRDAVGRDRERWVKHPEFDALFPGAGEGHWRVSEGYTNAWPELHLRLIAADAQAKLEDPTLPLLEIESPGIEFASPEFFGDLEGAFAEVLTHHPQGVMFKGHLLAAGPALMPNVGASPDDFPKNVAGAAAMMRLGNAESATILLPYAPRLADPDAPRTKELQQREAALRERQKNLRQQQSKNEVDPVATTRLTEALAAEERALIDAQQAYMGSREVWEFSLRAYEQALQEDLIPALRTAGLDPDKLIISKLQFGTDALRNIVMSGQVPRPVLQEAFRRAIVKGAELQAHGSPETPDLQGRSLLGADTSPGDLTLLLQGKATSSRGDGLPLKYNGVYETLRPFVERENKEVRTRTIRILQEAFPSWIDRETANAALRRTSKAEQSRKKKAAAVPHQP